MYKIFTPFCWFFKFSTNPRRGSRPVSNVLRKSIRFLFPGNERVSSQVHCGILILRMWQSNSYVQTFSIKCYSQEWMFYRIKSERLSRGTCTQIPLEHSWEMVIFCPGSAAESSWWQNPTSEMSHLWDRTKPIIFVPAAAKQHDVHVSSLPYAGGITFRVPVSARAVS